MLKLVKTEEKREFDTFVEGVRELEKNGGVRIKRISNLKDLAKEPASNLSPLERRALLLFKNGQL